ncbi:cytidylyltransferase domain-containing protein [Halanaerobacter jeridensis]|uniref:Spore coat polysaccharide biosynthesis protein SpsF n=1 Tax=Halanaerobacter jeridensis TaxID=706427 RepID=A0A939BPY9_9FIRM|nr:glycosyltransferase family protein [Halanaerobacter jeridensis]MBM7557453.1 spore coat polysaccharide biosynthesis protein SpsF [Halanaerobacter jeridensis]
MSPKIVCIIQARMGSTRLPGKVLKEIKGKPMIQYTLENLVHSKYIDQIVLATSVLDQDDAIEEFATEFGINLFRGSEEDVLSRYYHAAKEYDADIIVRVTGDCPLIDYQITDKVIETFLDNPKADFVANNLKRTFPRGVDTTVFKFSALEEAYKNADKQPEREHVVPYIQTTHRDKFNIMSYEAEGEFRRPDIRITVDEKDDFKLIKEIITRIEDEPINLEQVIDLLNQNPKLLKINEHVEQKKTNLSVNEEIE